MRGHGQCGSIHGLGVLYLHLELQADFCIFRACHHGNVDNFCGHEPSSVCDWGKKSLKMGNVAAFSNAALMR